jgi:hypothetical protein
MPSALAWSENEQVTSKRLLTIAGLALVLWIFAVPEMAYSQGNTWAGSSLTQMVEAARWKLGLLRINAALELNNVGYDSDIYFGYLDNPIPDSTFTASVPVQVLFPVNKRVVLDVIDSPQYLFYLETKNERAWNNVFKGQVHFALERFYIQAGGGSSNIRQRLSPELNINIRQKEDSMNGLILWQISRGTSFALLYDGAKYSYGDAEFGGTDLAQTLNRREDYFDIVTYVQPNSKVQLFLDGQYGTNAFTEAASRFKDTRSYGVFGGLNFVPREGEARPIAPIQGRISLGYKRFDIIDPALADGAGFVGAINVSAGLLKRTTGRASFSRDFQFSIYSNAIYYTSMTYGGGITRLISRKVSISYDLSFSRTSYPEDEAGGGVLQGIRNRYAIHSASLNIMLARYLRVSFLGTIGTRVMGQSSQAINRNFFGFNLIYGAATGTIFVPTSGLSR